MGFAIGFTRRGCNIIDRMRELWLKGKEEQKEEKNRNRDEMGKEELGRLASMATGRSVVHKTQKSKLSTSFWEIFFFLA